MQNRHPLMVRLTTVVVGVVMFAGVADAATQFVSDQLSINMRTGPSTGYKIMKLLDAGDKIDTLSEAKGWSKIRTEAGSTGYVLTRFLSDTPPASVRIDQFQQQNQQLSQENVELKQELSQALHGSDKLGELKQNLVDDNKSLKLQLQNIRETSADAIRIGNENKKYRQQLISLHADVDRLKHENAALQNRREGMKIGALILIVGIALGLLLPMFRRRRARSWDSL
jgi:SH3 domain protein